MIIHGKCGRAIIIVTEGVPEHSFITGDKAYNAYTIEDVRREAGIELIPLRKKNSLRPVPA